MIFKELSLKQIKRTFLEGESPTLKSLIYHKSKKQVGNSFLSKKILNGKLGKIKQKRRFICPPTRMIEKFYQQGYFPVFSLIFNI